MTAVHIRRSARAATDRAALARDLLLAEYTALKDEQRMRIGTRDNLLYATLAALAGVLTVTFTARDTAYLLLAGPASLILGWTYLANDEKISAAGTYIRTDLAPRLAELAGVEAFGWETAHRSVRSRATQKTAQMAVDLTAFAVPPAVAAAICWATSANSVPLSATGAVELLAAALLAARIIQSADFRTQTRDHVK